MALDTALIESLDTEVEYFGSEAAAGRYLALAIKGGQEPGEADLRFSELQRQAAEFAPPPAVETPASEEPAYPNEEVPLEVETVEEAA
jgi:hypothetical protein